MIKNKYHLKPKDVEKFIVVDKEKLTQKPFWRNTATTPNCWCLSWTNGKWDDVEYFIQFFDNDKIKLQCYADFGMCSVNFDEFFKPSDIEDKFILQLEENLLNTMNWLLDSGICKFERKKK